MKPKYLIFIFILLLMPCVLGNKLTKNGEGMANYTILFLNNRTAHQYTTITDDYGNFVLNRNLLTDDESKKDIIQVYIGKNLKGGCYKDIILEDGSIKYKCEFKNPDYRVILKLLRT